MFSVYIYIYTKSSSLTCTFHAVCVCVCDVDDSFVLSVLGAVMVGLSQSLQEINYGALLALGGAAL